METTSPKKIPGLTNQRTIKSTQGLIPVRHKEYKAYLGLGIVDRGLVEWLVRRIELLWLQNVIWLVVNIALPWHSWAFCYWIWLTRRTEPYYFSTFANGSTILLLGNASVASSVVPFKAAVALDPLLFCSDWMLTVDTVVGHLDSRVDFRRIIVE